MDIASVWVRVPLRVLNTKTMSRSYKKPYACWVCYFSNKKDKKIANKKFRRINKVFTRIDPEKLKHKLREVSNVWDFSSDGLAHYVGDSWLARSNDPADKESYRRWLQK